MWISHPRWSKFIYKYRRADLKRSGYLNICICIHLISDLKIHLTSANNFIMDKNSHNGLDYEPDSNFRVSFYNRRSDRLVFSQRFWTSILNYQVIEVTPFYRWENKYGKYLVRNVCKKQINQYIHTFKNIDPF